MPPPHALHAVVFLVPFLSRADGGLQSDALPVSPDQVLLNATRFALKLGEHTWGKDVKSNLKDNANWKNPDFYKAKRPPAATAPQYEVLEDSWWEQRQWGITLAIDTLVSGRHRMAGPLVTEMNKLKPEVPSPAGFIKAAAGTPYTCGGETVQFDTNVGLPFFSFFFLPFRLWCRGLDFPPLSFVCGVANRFLSLSFFLPLYLSLSSVFLFKITRTVS